MNNSLHVAPYASEHADELRAVCLEQASERARTEEAHGRFTLLMYCDAYLEHGVAAANERELWASTATWASRSSPSTPTGRASRSA